MAVSLLGRKCMQNAGKYEPIQKRSTRMGTF
jgi:hypothetical protein